MVSTPNVTAPKSEHDLALEAIQWFKKSIYLQRGGKKEKNNCKHLSKTWSTPIDAILNDQLGMIQLYNLGIVNI